MAASKLEPRPVPPVIAALIVKLAHATKREG
jgi:hypothetical protein